MDETAGAVSQLLFGQRLIRMLQREQVGEKVAKYFLLNSSMSPLSRSNCARKSDDYRRPRLIGQTSDSIIQR